MRNLDKMLHDRDVQVFSKVADERKVMQDEAKVDMLKWNKTIDAYRTLLHRACDILGGVIDRFTLPGCALFCLAYYVKCISLFPSTFQVYFLQQTCTCTLCMRECIRVSTLWLANILCRPYRILVAFLPCIKCFMAPFTLVET